MNDGAIKGGAILLTPLSDIYTVSSDTQQESHFNINNCTFTDNTVKSELYHSNGGAIAAENVTLNINNSRFVNNKQPLLNKTTQ